MKKTVAKELGNITVTDYKFERRFGSSAIVTLLYNRNNVKFCKIWNKPIDTIFISCYYIHVVSKAKKEKR